MATWGKDVLPGTVFIGLVVIARLLGLLQSLELKTLDTFLRLRPPEPMDERVVIIGIDEEDIQQLETYPLPDAEIASLLQTLQAYEPAVIGLNIFRDLPVEPGHSQLTATFRESPNLIVIERALPPVIAPPQGLPPEQIGLIDVDPDRDDNVRRMLLGTPRPQRPEEYALAFALRLVDTYLLTIKGISLENGIRDPEAMRFGSTELPRFWSNSGGYVQADDGGVQMLLNFRSGQPAFRVLSLEDIKTRNFDPNWIHNRIIIIGHTAHSVKDTLNSSVVSGLAPSGKVYGVELQAHAVSQIISAVLDGRPLLRVWPKWGEYLWLFSWGLLGIYLSQLIKPQIRNILGLENLLWTSLVSITLIFISHLFLVFGWWIPVIPTLLTFCSIRCFDIFQRYAAKLKIERDLKARIDTIEHTFDTIHNGPLQTLASLIRRSRSETLPQWLLEDLERLNYEIRSVGGHLKQQTLTQEESFYLGSGRKLDLKLPVKDLLYEVYTNTLKRDLPGFKVLKIKIPTFDAIDEQYLNFEIKRRFCWFLEEALCNVGKHAIGTTRLSVIGTYSHGWYRLSVADNGSGVQASCEGQGTKSCRELANKLKGKFKREPIFPNGTQCELALPIIEKRMKKIERREI
ncbi:MAG: CHASE2 domain-containing protein [Cyanothece sp. SIO1E1]|nr:CHASE2 domain-containing protein [Cyanothece sp. SIO1E1]